MIDSKLLLEKINEVVEELQTKQQELRGTRFLRISGLLSREIGVHIVREIVINMAKKTTTPFLAYHTYVKEPKCCDIQWADHMHPWYPFYNGDGGGQLTVCKLSACKRSSTEHPGTPVWI